jgi:solute:Na+ symporter, SSS family
MWITGLAFLTANLGALEMIGMVANTAKYGLLTVHYYWIGAIPAMIFLGIFMMPFYYGSKIRSVPGYLKLRYNEATRSLNAISFAVMTLLMSGISMYAMALLFQMLLGWSLTASIMLSAGIVCIYVFWGGLTSSIYNEVIQFFLIWLGLLPVVFLGLKDVGGLAGLMSRVPETFMHTWQNLGSSAANPIGIEWIGVVMGLGFVLSFGYWTTDFLVIQHALASKDLPSAQKTPILAAFPKILVPIIAILPGLIAVAVLPEFSIKAANAAGGAAGAAAASPDYNSALFLLIKHYLPDGILGLAITGLLASFMSGMAGNVTAFNTVWTYDIYATHIKKNMPDTHYLWVGKFTTLIGVILSVGTTYIVCSFPNLMDYMQLIFSFFNAPLFATFLLGMFWRGATPWGGFWGLLIGIIAAMIHYACYKMNLIHYGSDMGANFYQAWWAWLTDFVVTIVVSKFTAPKDVKELEGLVYGLSSKTATAAVPALSFFARPVVWGIAALVMMVIINLMFW